MSIQKHLASASIITSLVLGGMLLPGLAQAQNGKGYSDLGQACPSAGCAYGEVCSSGVCVLTSSQSGSGSINTTYIQGYADSIIGIINAILVPVLMAVSFIVFLYGVYKYFILGGADESAHSEGRTFIIYGVIGFVVILSVWSLVTILTQTLGLSPGGHAPSVPTL